MSTKFMLTLPDDLHARLKKRCKDLEITMNEALVALVTNVLSDPDGEGDELSEFKAGMTDCGLSELLIQHEVYLQRCRIQRKKLWSTGKMTE